eukprot:gene24982-13678_t
MNVDNDDFCGVGAGVWTGCHLDAQDQWSWDGTGEACGDSASSESWNSLRSDSGEHCVHLWFCSQKWATHFCSGEEQGYICEDNDEVGKMSTAAPLPSGSSTTSTITTTTTTTSATTPTTPTTPLQAAYQSPAPKSALTSVLVAMILIVLIVIVAAWYVQRNAKNNNKAAIPQVITNTALRAGGAGSAGSARARAALASVPATYNNRSTVYAIPMDDVGVRGGGGGGASASSLSNGVYYDADPVPVGDASYAEPDMLSDALDTNSSAYASVYDTAVHNSDNTGRPVTTEYNHLSPSSQPNTRSMDVNGYQIDGHDADASRVAEGIDGNGNGTRNMDVNGYQIDGHDADQRQEQEQERNNHYDLGSQQQHRHQQSPQSPQQQERNNHYDLGPVQRRLVDQNNHYDLAPHQRDLINNSGVSSGGGGGSNINEESEL